jgi:ubiquinone/menaquinone biosynthesis C-methylase UbiE
MKSVTPTFDSSAATFNRYRALPTGVPEAIRAAIWKSTRNQRPARVLDIGAGAGRIGRAFVDADDFNDLYVGVDASLAMLQEFRKLSRAASLAQADGEQLPFGAGIFDVVMLMQVLSGAQDWRGLLNEVRRVLRSTGIVVVGHTMNPQAGVDAQLKRRLATILEDMGVEFHESNRARKQSLAWLESSATRSTHMIAATWMAERTPREFLIRHRTGARFSALPLAIQEEALQKLSAWAENEFGSLDASHTEEVSFELDIFEF